MRTCTRRGAGSPGGAASGLRTLSTTTLQGNADAATGGPRHYLCATVKRLLKGCCNLAVWIVDTLPNRGHAGAGGGGTAGLGARGPAASRDGPLAPGAFGVRPPRNRGRVYPLPARPGVQLRCLQRSRQGGERAGGRVCGQRGGGRERGDCLQPPPHSAGPLLDEFRV